MITSEEHFWRSDFIHCTISTLTVVVPCLTKSNFSATARDTSTIRFREVGPQSLTVASTLFPFFVFVILTLVPTAGFYVLSSVLTPHTSLHRRSYDLPRPGCRTRLVLSESG